MENKLTTQISLFATLNAKTNTTYTLQNIIDLIKNETYKDEILAIRNESEKSKQNELKKLLPAVTISGLFYNQHKSENLKFHSGLIQIDIDDLEKNRLSELRGKFITDKYTLACFHSPSGNGLKLIFKIPASIETHLQSFFAIEKYFLDVYKQQIDKSCKDVSRLMFMCSDINIYTNFESEIFTDLYSNIKTTTKNQNQKIHFANDVYSDIENCIIQIEQRQIDITNNYEDWLKIGFSLSDAIGENGREFYHRISQVSSKYESLECDKQYSKCINGKNNGITKSTFFKICQDYGIDTKSPKEQKNNNFYNVNKKEKEAEIEVEISEYHEIKTPIPKSVESKNEFEDLYNFYFIENEYFVINDYRGKRNANRVSNFIMKILYFFPDGSNNAKRLVKLQNKYGEIELIELISKDMNLSNFKNCIRSKGNFVFNGTQTDLDKIFEYLHKEEITAKYITTLGYQTDENIFAFANGIITLQNTFVPCDSFGVVRHCNKSYYLPAFSCLNQHNEAFLNERRFRYINGNIDFSNLSELMYKAYGVNGIIGISFYIASLFRDIIFRETGNFPYLFLFGDTGVGKTSFVEILLSLFGEPQLGISLEGKSTTNGIVRRLSHFKNGLCYLNEYSNNVHDSTIGILKSAYNGIGKDSAQYSNDNKTQQTAVNSGLIIDGNQLPEKSSALYSRVIEVDFRKIDFTDEQKKAYNQLGIEAKNGLTQITKEIFSYRELINTQFKAIYDNALKYLKHERCKDLNLLSRTLEHIALLISPIKILENKLNFHLSKKDILETLVEYAIEQTEAIEGTKEINIFFNSLEYLLSQNKIFIDRHFKIKTEDNRQILWLKVESIYSHYNEYCIKQNLNNLGKNALQKLLQEHKALIKPIEKFQKKDRDIGYCYCLIYDMLGINLIHTIKNAE